MSCEASNASALPNHSRTGYVIVMGGAFEWRAFSRSLFSLFLRTRQSQTKLERTKESWGVVTGQHHAPCYTLYKHWWSCLSFLSWWLYTRASPPTLARAFSLFVCHLYIFRLLSFSLFLTLTHHTDEKYELKEIHRGKKLSRLNFTFFTNFVNFDLEDY